VVRITNGPFADMLALFEGPTKPVERVVVLLNFLGQASRVRLNATDLEVVTSSVEVKPPKRPRRTRGRGRPIRTPPRLYEAN
jgi:hypothetical protein